MAEDYESMTVSELKEILRERELKLSGKKSELIERLLEFDGVDVSAEDASESDEEVESSESDDDFDDFDDDDYDVEVIYQK